MWDENGWPDDVFEVDGEPLNVNALWRAERER